MNTANSVTPIRIAKNVKIPSLIQAGKDLRKHHMHVYKVASGRANGPVVLKRFEDWMEKNGFIPAWQGNTPEPAGKETSKATPGVSLAQQWAKLVWATVEARGIRYPEAWALCRNLNPAEYAAYLRSIPPMPTLEEEPQDEEALKRQDLEYRLKCVTEACAALNRWIRITAREASEANVPAEELEEWCARRYPDAYAAYQSTGAAIQEVNEIDAGDDESGAASNAADEVPAETSTPTEPRN